MNSEVFSGKASNYIFAALLAGSVLLIGESAVANDGSFRDFKAMNPGLDKGALRQLWNGGASGGGTGFSVGFVMPSAGAASHVAPVPTPDPGRGANIGVGSFRDFKDMNPGIDNTTLRQIYNGGRPGPEGAIGIGLINAPASTVVDTRNQISLAEFKDLNPGLDRKTVKQMYRHLKSNEGGVTIGIIPTTGRFSNPHSDPSTTGLSSFGTINVNTGR